MNKLRLPRDGAEYAHFTFSPPLSGVDACDAQIDSTWYSVDLTVSPPRLLLRGPSAPAGTAGVLVSKDGPLRVRVKIGTEVIVRGAGYVTLVS